MGVNNDNSVDYPISPGLPAKNLKKAGMIWHSALRNGN